MGTPYPTTAEISKAWHVIDCAGQPVGRLATRIAKLLRGKHKPSFTPHLDTGDFVIAINVEALTFTGDKLNQKTYWSHSGYFGGIRGTSAKELQQRHPEAILRKAVKGMLPRNRLAPVWLRKLKIYTGASHPHAAQVAAKA